MDSNRSKGRSFSKSKLIMSLYRATKPSSAALHKPPKPSPTYSSAASAEFPANQPIKPKPHPVSAAAANSPAHVGFIFVNQDQVFSRPTPKLSFVVAERNPDSYGKLENFYSGGGGGGAAVEDEGVDDKATKYITGVQERFRLEQVNWERKNFQDIHV